MAAQTWVQLVNAYQPNGVTQGAIFENSAVLTDISPGGKAAGAALTIPAGFLNPGAQIRFKVCGEYSTKAVEEKITCGLYWGGVGGKCLARTNATAATSTKEQGFELFATTRILALPAAPTEAQFKEAEALTQGHVLGIMKPLVGEAAAYLAQSLPMEKPKAAVSAGETEPKGGLQKIDLTVASILTFGWKFALASTENKAQVLQWQVELFN